VLIIAKMSRCAPRSEISRRRVALDDFGSGYSSLNYVKELLVDDLKIDKSFIDSLGEDVVNDAIVRLIVDLAHTLGLKVIAEGSRTTGKWRA
jgi:sensor c-di-GMP phosphodiesterase-like protein